VSLPKPHQVVRPGHVFRTPRGWVRVVRVDGERVIGEQRGPLDDVGIVGAGRPIATPAAS